MKQKLCLVLIAAISLICNFSYAQTQDVQQLPADPRVKSGTLANGLTYYIFKNDAVKGRADFAVVHKTGTSLEKDNQKGMSKMLELLSIRGTRNFADSTIVRYLNTIGVQDKNIIFDTRADESVYTIENVPVSRQNTMDSTLLILYNWMSGINIDEEDIAETLPMLRNSLLDEWDAQKRIEDKLIKELYPKSPYANSISAEQINSLKGYSSKELRNFYYQWFRPDLQAVFVVGDVDPAKVETQIKSIFATIPKPLKAEKRSYYKPKMVDGTKVMIEKDPEYNKTSVVINFLRTPLIAKYKLTSVPYIEAFFDDAISSLLLRRIQGGIVEQNLPINNVKIEKGKFMDMTNLETFAVSFETLPGSVYSAISYLSGEINRIARYGFNNQEFNNSREKHFRELENVYDNRFNQPNSLFMKRVMNHYLDGYSLASIEMHFEIMKELLYTLKTEQLNNYATAMLGQKEGVVISCNMPDVDGVEELSVERLKNSFENSLAKSEYKGSESSLVVWPKFEQQGRQGAILHHSTDPVTGAMVYNLSNGIKVIFKKTEGSRDTLSFRAVSKGGLSVANAGFGSEMKLYISDIANLSSVGGISRTDWYKLFSYNNLSLKGDINDHLEKLEGYSGVSGMEKLFHLIQLYFTTRKDDAKSFEVYKKGKSAEALYHQLSPLNVFEDSVLFYNSSNKRFVPTHSKEYVENMDYARISRAIKGRFANPADFVFIFAGNVETSRIEQCIVKYLGSLYGSEDREDWLVNPDYSAKGRLERRFLHQMVLPRTFVDITISCGMRNTQENRVLGFMLQEYLSAFYSGGAIKEMSPKSSVSAVMGYYPEEILMCRQRFETDSAGSVEICNLLKAKLQELSNKGMEQNDFAKLQRSIKQRFEADMQKNRYWLDVFTDSYLFGQNFHNGYVSAIEKITPEMFREFVDMVYRRGNMITVIMEGTTEDVNTQNLFRENQFIKEFFDL